MVHAMKSKAGRKPKNKTSVRVQLLDLLAALGSDGATASEAAMLLELALPSVSSILSQMYAQSEARRLPIDSKFAVGRAEYRYYDKDTNIGTKRMYPLHPTNPQSTNNSKMTPATSHAKAALKLHDFKKAKQPVGTLPGAAIEPVQMQVDVAQPVVKSPKPYSLRVRYEMYVGDTVIELTETQFKAMS